MNKEDIDVGFKYVNTLGKIVEILENDYGCLKIDSTSWMNGPYNQYVSEIYENIMKGHYSIFNNEKNLYEIW